MGLCYASYPQETLAFTTTFNTLQEIRTRGSIDSLHLFHDVYITRTETFSSVFGSVLLYLKVEAKIVYPVKGVLIPQETYAGTHLDVLATVSQ